MTQPNSHQQSEFTPDSKLTKNIRTEPLIVTNTNEVAGYTHTVIEIPIQIPILNTKTQDRSYKRPKDVQIQIKRPNLQQITLNEIGQWLKVAIKRDISKEDSNQSGRDKSILTQLLKIQGIIKAQLEFVSSIHGNDLDQMISNIDSQNQHKSELAEDNQPTIKQNEHVPMEISIQTERIKYVYIPVEVVIDRIVPTQPNGQIFASTKDMNVMQKMIEAGNIVETQKIVQNLVNAKVEIQQPIKVQLTDTYYEVPVEIEKPVPQIQIIEKPYNLEQALQELMRNEDNIAILQRFFVQHFKMPVSQDTNICYVEVLKIIEKPILVDKISYYEVPVQVSKGIQETQHQDSQDVYKIIQVPQEIIIYKQLPVYMQTEVLKIVETSGRKPLEEQTINRPIKQFNGTEQKLNSNRRITMKMAESIYDQNTQSMAEQLKPDRIQQEQFQVVDTHSQNRSLTEEDEQQYEQQYKQQYKQQQDTQFPMDLIKSSIVINKLKSDEQKHTIEQKVIKQTQSMIPFAQIQYLRRNLQQMQQNLKQEKQLSANLQLVLQSQRQMNQTFKFELDRKYIQIEELQQKFNSVGQQLDRTKLADKQLHKKNQMLQRELEQLLQRISLITQLQQQNIQLQNINQQSRVENIQLKQQISHYKQQIEQFQANILEYKREIQEQTAAVLRYKEMLIEGDSVIEMIVEEKEQLQRRLDQYQLTGRFNTSDHDETPNKLVLKENKQLLEDLYELGRKNKQYEDSVRELTQQVEKLSQQIKLSQPNKISEFEIEYYKNLLDKVKNQNRQLKIKVSQLGGHNASLNSSNRSNHNSYSSHRSKLGEHSKSQLDLKQLKGLRVEEMTYDNIRSAVNLLEETTLKLEKTQKANQQLKQLLNLQEKQNTKEQIKTPTRVAYRESVLKRAMLEANVNKFMESGNLDARIKQIIILIMKRLQEEQVLNDNLLQKIASLEKEIKTYQKQILDKSSKINYLNLAITNKETCEFGMKSTKKKLNLTPQNQNKLVSQTEEFALAQQNLIYYQNVVIPNLKNQIKKYEEVLSSPVSEIPTSPKSISRHRQKSPILEITKLQQNLLHFKNQNESFRKEMSYQNSLLPDNDIFVKKLTNRSNLRYKPINLEIFIKTQSFNTASLLTLMLRLAEAAQEMLHRKKLSTIHPRRIFVIQFDNVNFNAIEVRIENLQLHQQQRDIKLYTAPEVLKGDKYSQTALAWNLGVIYDMLINKQPFFKTQSEILNPKTLYKAESQNFPIVHRILQKLLARAPFSRLSLENLALNIRFELKRLIYSK